MTRQEWQWGEGTRGWIPTTSQDDPGARKVFLSVSPMILLIVLSRGIGSFSLPGIFTIFSDLGGRPDTQKVWMSQLAQGEHSAWETAPWQVINPSQSQLPYL